jgi:nucleoside-diphosphate-sugar epimerase
MKVLVLGGSGYIGSRLCEKMAQSSWITPVSASSRRSASGVENVQVDTTNRKSLQQALRGVDAVINCVAGSAHAIADGAKVLVDASIGSGCERIVHLSSMAVYGSREGAVGEQAPLAPALGWYARAKCKAENHIAEFGEAGGSAVTLRPGCVWGPGSQLWVGRIGRYLEAGRLGDLGANGDGWSNLVHVDDVCHAVIAALRIEPAPGDVRVYNLAAPDSPRWNDYFIDLALEIGATPVRRISSMQLRADAWLGGPALKIAQTALSRAGHARAVPDPLPPGLVGLWERHLHLESAKAEHELDLRWTPYADGLRQSAQWYRQVQSHAH